MLAFVICYKFGISIFFFFFQAEDGIRDCHVTGVQTCALPIWRQGRREPPSLQRQRDDRLVRSETSRRAQVARCQQRSRHERYRRRPPNDARPLGGWDRAKSRINSDVDRGQVTNREDLTGRNLACDGEHRLALAQLVRDAPTSQSDTEAHTTPKTAPA